MSPKNETLRDIYDEVLRRNPGETEFHQAVYEVLTASPRWSPSTPSTPIPR